MYPFQKLSDYNHYHFMDDNDQQQQQQQQQSTIRLWKKSSSSSMINNVMVDNMAVSGMFNLLFLILIFDSIFSPIQKSFRFNWIDNKSNGFK